MAKSASGTRFRLRIVWCGWAAILLSALYLLLWPSCSEAHSPRFQRDGSDSAAPTVVVDPLKSWAFYGYLQNGRDVRYFAVNLEQGQRLRLNLLTPEGTAFAPSLAVIGPGLADEGQLPDYVRKPDGSGAVVVKGHRDVFEYEPFTPGAYVFTAEFDLTVPVTGSYVVAVFEREGRSGPFSLAIGYEERFSLGEWVLLPFQLVRIYLWEGDPWPLVFGPALFLLVLGASVLLWRHKKGKSMSPFQMTTIVAGFLYLASAANLVAQMLQSVSRSGFSGAVAITAGFIILAVAAGAVLVRLGWTSQAPSRRSRLLLLVVSAAGLALLAGFVIGPVLAFVAALFPRGSKDAPASFPCNLR